MTRKQLFLAILISSASITLSGQEKLEREYRIPQKRVPTKAQNFVNKMQLEGNVKWFIEESLQGKSMEAKVISQKVKYSIEFDTLGNLQDIEIQIKKKQVPNNVWKNIDKELSSSLKKHKVIKIQQQLSGDSQQVLQAFLKKSFERITIKYELVVKGKAGKKKHLFEYTFSNSGNFEKREKIIFRNSDNLEY